MDITSQLYLSYLQTLTKDLLFISESEYPWKVVYLGKNKQEALNQLPFEVKNAQEITLEKLLKNHIKEENWYGEEELAVAKKYQNLQNLLQEQVTDVSTYRYGEIEIHIYVV
ncbi:MAG: nuclease A inhibitor family protein, partial [Thermoflexibacter sp.]|nr:nuclease A inhibitor family protein [Thermoflexibacter sp.]